MNIFYGNNGSGKTNLLESIFTLCLGRSQRGAADSILIQDGAEVYRLEGRVETARRALPVAVAYQKGWRKKITIDGVPSKATELYDQFCAVASGPEDSDILSGSPAVRRLFIDIYLSQLSRRYISDLTDYQKAIAQKNAALKKEMDPSPFDPLVVSHGSKIIAARHKFLGSLRPLTENHYREISRGEELQMEYKPKIAVESDTCEESEIKEAFELALEENKFKEQVLKTSVVGPHRDDVLFEVGGLAARSHGSQGQWRTAAVSLKLAVYELLKEKRSTAPILLLDEIFAELDTGRTERLMELFSQSDQIFLTTAIDPPQSLIDTARKFRIVGGAIEGID